ncbi:MAG TPA: TetR/AcrR family transcriptional regulator [Rhabdochlamydiaceae bacterium]
MKKANLRKRVFESAWQIAASEGFEQLNIRRLAQLSSCAVGSIYNAFGSFQDLQLHINAKILKELYQILNETTERAIEDKKSLRTLFIDLGLAYIEFGKKNRLLWKTLFEHFPNEPIPEWYGKTAQEGIYQICGRISDAFGISEADAKQIVGFFWAAIHGVSAILLNRKMEMVADLIDADNLEPYVEYCLDGLFNLRGACNA